MQKFRKIIPYLLVLAVLTGGFISANKAGAQTTEVCWTLSGTTWIQNSLNVVGSKNICDQRGGRWQATAPASPVPPSPTTPSGQCTSNGIPNGKNYTDCRLPDIWGAIPPATTTTPTPPETTGLGNNLPSCAVLPPNVAGCLTQIAYFLLNVIPSFLLGFSAMFFNAIVALTLSNKMIGGSAFIPSAWAVVRDISNIFFILILLYIAIRTILGMGGETKKMIAQVIIMALLINFSMFFTKVIIDTSNVLALIFYNKINTETTVDGVKKTYLPATNTGIEKDISGGMTNAFNPGKLLSQEFFENAKKTTDVVPKTVTGAVVAISLAPITMGGSLVGYFLPSKEVPISLLLGMIVISGAIMLFATYAFFIAGISFLGRLIELWLLIIFSPFAFMSSALPMLDKLEYIGWEAWLKRLIAVSFMAPIFMFFMYFIFRLINANIFSDLMRGNTPENPATTLETVLFVIIPALFILILLLKATEFAKKGGGKFAEVTLGAIKAGTVLALGGAALGGAALARGSIGAFMKGASTGDTAANRMVGSAGRIATHQAVLANPASTIVQRAQAKKEIWRERKDQIKGDIQQRLGIQGLQEKIGKTLNEDQHNVEHAAHARHELDTAAGAVAPGKKWDDLNGEKRYEARRKIARDEFVRNNSGVTGMAFGTRKWEALTDVEKAAVDASAAVGNDFATGHAIHGGALDTHTTVADKKIADARSKQGIISSVAQATITGNYDVRNLAKMVAREQTTGMTKFSTGLVAGLAMTMRSGFKTMGVNYGEGQGNYLKDLSDTITEALKNVKLNVEIPKVGEVKKESASHAGGGGHH